MFPDATLVAWFWVGAALMPAGYVALFLLARRPVSEFAFADRWGEPLQEP